MLGDCTLFPFDDRFDDAVPSMYDAEVHTPFSDVSSPIQPNLAAFDMPYSLDYHDIPFAYPVEAAPPAVRKTDSTIGPRKSRVFKPFTDFRSAEMVVKTLNDVLKHRSNAMNDQ